MTDAATHLIAGHVLVPLTEFRAMANCYYGLGPRFGERGSPHAVAPIPASGPPPPATVTEVRAAMRDLPSLVPLGKARRKVESVAPPPSGDLP